MLQPLTELACRRASAPVAGVVHDIFDWCTFVSQGLEYPDTFAASYPKVAHLPGTAQELLTHVTQYAHAETDEKYLVQSALCYAHDVLGFLTKIGDTDAIPAEYRHLAEAALLLHAQNWPEACIQSREQIQPNLQGSATARTGSLLCLYATLLSGKRPSYAVLSHLAQADIKDWDFLSVFVTCILFKTAHFRPDIEDVPQYFELEITQMLEILEQYPYLGQPLF